MQNLGTSVCTAELYCCVYRLSIHWRYSTAHALPAAQVTTEAWGEARTSEGTPLDKLTLHPLIGGYHKLLLHKFFSQCMCKRPNCVRGVGDWEMIGVQC
jgi:hypothetical protein